MEVRMVKDKSKIIINKDKINLTINEDKSKPSINDNYSKLSINDNHSKVDLNKYDTPPVKKRRYIKGLLIRIIICCSIFLILFIANMVRAELFDVDTQKVVSAVGDNDIVERIEGVLKDFMNK